MTIDRAGLPTIRDVSPEEARTSLREVLDHLYEHYDGAVGPMTASLLRGVEEQAINGASYETCYIGHLISGSPGTFVVISGENYMDVVEEVREGVDPEADDRNMLPIELWVSPVRPHYATEHIVWERVILDAIAQWTHEWLSEHAEFAEV